MSRHTTRVRAGNDRASLYTEITDKIIAELEGGRIPWVQPWGTAAIKAPLAMPRNASTQRGYSGPNARQLRASRCWPCLRDGATSTTTCRRSGSKSCGQRYAHSSHPRMPRDTSPKRRRQPVDGWRIWAAPVDPVMGTSELLRIDDGTCPQAAVAIDAKSLQRTSYASI
jgi:N-terminal domain of anti-restriction factor ArdC